MRDRLARFGHEIERKATHVAAAMLVFVAMAADRPHVAHAGDPIPPRKPVKVLPLSGELQIAIGDAPKPSGEIQKHFLRGSDGKYMEFPVIAGEGFQSALQGVRGKRVQIDYTNGVASSAVVDVKAPLYIPLLLQFVASGFDNSIWV